MAVYTELTDTEINALLRGYELGKLSSAKGIAEGVQNTNYLLTVAGKRYVLTLCEEKLSAADVEYIFALMRHLAEHQFPCPLPVVMTNGALWQKIKGKPAALVTFLEGRSCDAITPEHVRSVGTLLARQHAAAQKFTLMRNNHLSLAGWKKLFDALEEDADDITPGLAAEVAEELVWLENNWPKDLPFGAVHADLFPDNVFFDGTNVIGVIDFYFACDDFLAYDLMIVLVAWCFDGDVLNRAKTEALIKGYEEVRLLSSAERAALPILARGAALRFLLTRAYDGMFRDGALVTPKDPMEYVMKLRALKAKGIWG